MQVPARPGPRLRATLAIVAGVAIAPACSPGGRTQPASTRDGGHPTATVVRDAGREPCADLTPEQRAMVVARVGDETLTLCDFARRINLQNQYLRARFSAPEQRRALLQSWVDSELLATEARARGLDQDPAVRHAVTSQLARELETEVRNGVAQPVVTEADVQAFYDAHRAEYDTPEQVRASQIVTATRADAERALTEARAHAADDAAWRALAQRDSQDAATRSIGGDMGFFGREGSTTVPVEVAAAAFALHAPGDIAPAVVPTAHGGPNHAAGFHVVRFIARRDALHRTLDDVSRQIRNRLYRERAEQAQQAAVHDLVQRLRDEAHVTVDETALAQVQLQAAPVAPPAGSPAIAPMTPPAR